MNGDAVKKQKILECLAMALNQETAAIMELPLDYSLKQIGFDSLNFIRFLVLSEEMFGFTLNDSDLLMEKFETLGGIYDMLSEYVGGYDET